MSMSFKIEPVNMSSKGGWGAGDTMHVFLFLY
jgi:hypothetical protein